MAESFATRLEKSIADKKTEAQGASGMVAKLYRDNVTIDEAARLYFWGRSEPLLDGISSSVANPLDQFPILPQLLYTPRLTVDIDALDPLRFKSTYGVTVSQMIKLVEAGLVIPNIYRRVGDEWREYLKYPELEGILCHRVTRMNGEWTSLLLDRYFGRFSYYVHASEELIIRALKDASEAECKEMLDATKGRCVSEAALLGAYSQRLAYLQTIGVRKGLGGLAKRIKSNLGRAGSRAQAIRELNAVKQEVATEITAAFGGFSHLTKSQVVEARDNFPPLVRLTAGTRFSAVQNRLMLPEECRPRIEFCLDVISEYFDFGADNDTRSGSAKMFCLDDAEFDTFLRKILLSTIVKSGGLNRLSQEIAEIFEENGDVDVALTAKKLIETRKEYESLLRSWGPIARASKRVADFSVGVGRAMENKPTNPVLALALQVVGTYIDVYVSRLEERRYAPMFRGRRTRKICSFLVDLRKDLQN